MCNVYVFLTIHLRFEIVMIVTVRIIMDDIGTIVMSMIVTIL